MIVHECGYYNKQVGYTSRNGIILRNPLGIKYGTEWIILRSDYWHRKTGVTKSHRSDIATENSFSMGERERDRFGALQWRKAERRNRKVRVRVGLDTGFMVLDLILYTFHTIAMHLFRNNDTFKYLKLKRFGEELW